MCSIYTLNSQTLYICSSILTAAIYALFVVYGFFWSKQPGLEWIPPMCIAAVFFVGSMGILPLPYIMAPELLPRKVFELIQLASTFLSIHVVNPTLFPSFFLDL